MFIYPGKDIGSGGKNIFINAIENASVQIAFIALQFIYLWRMLANDDLQQRWWKLEEKLMQRFEKKPDVESILFLIGIQELGDIHVKFSKEQKQDLMHIAICTILGPSGYYELEGVDADGWPHFKQLKPMPNMNPFEQEAFLKDHILLYFQNHDL